MPSENIYGHQKRLNWIRSLISRKNRIIEFGCGTGHMITIPLVKEGFRVTGIDRDKRSIDFGKTLLLHEGLPLDILKISLTEKCKKNVDVIIASEVLEHLHDDDLRRAIDEFYSILDKKGLLLITVPNGYGLFELESFLWYKTGLGSLLTRIPGLINRLGLRKLVNRGKKAIHGRGDLIEETILPSTLADSPHVQRFTRGKLRRLLNKHGFDVVAIHGSVLVAGPFSNLLFGGLAKLVELNSALAGRFPGIAAGYFVEARKMSVSVQSVKATGK